MADLDIVYGWNRDGYMESLVENRFGKIMWLCGLYPKIQGRYLYISVALYSFIYAVYMLHIFSFLYAAISFMPDITLVSDVMTYSVNNGLCFFMSYSIVSKRKVFERAFLQTENSFCYDEEIPTLESDKKLMKHIKIGLITAICMALCLVLGVVFIAPYVESVWGKEIEARPNIDIHLPKPSWSPEPNNKMIRYMLIIGQMLDMTVISTTILGTLIYLMNITVHFLKEIHILNWSLLNLEGRARNHYNSIITNESSLKVNWSFSDSINHCLKLNAKHYIAIKKFSEDYNDWIDRHMFLIMMVISFSIGFTLLGVTSGENHPGKVIAGIIVSVLEAYLLSLTAIMAQMISNESETLRDSVYEINWFDYDTKAKRTINILQLMFNKPIDVTIGQGLCVINCESLQQVFSSAYSFLNLLSAFKSR